MYSHDIPTIADLTPSFFEHLLREQGDLEHATSVVGVEFAPFGNAESMMSALHRATLTYSGPTSAPTTVIVKVASESDRQRFIAGMFKFYEREIRFYAELRDRVAVRTPRSWLATIHPEEPQFVLVLEEVKGLRQVDQLDGVALDDATRCMSTLADLHAPFWGTDMSALEETFMPMNSPGVQLLIPDAFAGDWAIGRDKMLHELPDEVLALCDRWPTVAAQVLDNMQEPNTLTHCDFRSDNLLFDTDGSVVVLDFQLAAISNGAVDVAYFISQSVREDVAAEHADALLDEYLHQLEARGVTYDRDDALRHYRAGLVFFLSIPVSLLGASSSDLHARGIELARTMLRRAAAEIIRTGAHLQFP